MDKYFLPDNYKTNPTGFCSQSGRTDGYQNDIYAIARELADKYGYFNKSSKGRDNVVWAGCMKAANWAALKPFPNFKTLGFNDTWFNMQLREKKIKKDSHKATLAVHLKHPYAYDMGNIPVPEEEYNE